MNTVNTEQRNSMPSIEITFRNKLTPDQLQEITDKIIELIPEPIVSVDYDEVDHFEHRIARDKGKIVKKTETGYIIEP